VKKKKKEKEKDSINEEANENKEEIKKITEIIDARLGGAGLKYDINILSVENCLASFTSPELLANENAFGCVNCTRQFIRQKNKRNERIRYRTS